MPLKLSGGKGGLDAQKFESGKNVKHHAVQSPEIVGEETEAQKGEKISELVSGRGTLRSPISKLLLIPMPAVTLCLINETWLIIITASVYGVYGLSHAK